MASKKVSILNLDKAREILGGKLPSFITNNRFNSQGFIESPEGLLIPLYLASGLGFNHPGKQFIQQELKPQLRSMGYCVIDAFEQCGEFFDSSTRDGGQSVADQLRKWEIFQQKAGIVMFDLLIPRAKVMLAVLEGAPDDGVAAEITYMVSNNFGPVVGIRSDSRLAENPATGTNIAVRYFMEPRFGGAYFEGADAYGRGYLRLKEIASKLLLRA